MAGFWGDVLCLALQRGNAVIRGAVYGCLGPLCSSWDKLTSEELLLEAGRGLVRGALEGLLGVEEEDLSVEGVRVVCEREGVVEVEVESGLLVEEEAGQSDSAQVEGADQQVASSSTFSASVVSSPAAPLPTSDSQSSHSPAKGASGRAELTPPEASFDEGGLFSADAFTPTEICPPEFDIFSGPGFEMEALPSCLDTPIPCHAMPETCHRAETPVAREMSSVTPSFEALLALMSGGVSETAECVEGVYLVEDGGAGVIDGQEGPEVGLLQRGNTAMVQDWLQADTPYEALAATLEFFPDVSILHQLGKGGQGEVHFATAFDSEGTFRMLAIKVQRPDRTTRDDALLQEAYNLLACRGCPNVIPLVGYTFCQGRLGLLFEVADPAPLWSVRGASLDYSPQQLALIARYGYQAATGLAWMHERDLLHRFALYWVWGLPEIGILGCTRLASLQLPGSCWTATFRDIKPENILISGAVAKLADMGMAVHQIDVEQQEKPCGTVCYIAPEVYVEGLHTKESDVFAFGVTLHNLMTGTRPYWEYQNTNAVRDLFDEGERFDWPDEIYEHGDNLVDLIERCWDTRPEERPTAAALVRALLGISLRLSARRG